MARGRKTGGRKVGTPNKATAQAREAIAEFLDGNVNKLDGWLDQIEKEDGPKVAFQCFTALLEYHIPKIQRTEQPPAEEEQHRVELHIVDHAYVRQQREAEEQLAEQKGQKPCPEA